MNFISTRNKNTFVTLSEALQNGLACDGGLYVPEAFPTFDWQSLTTDLPYAKFAVKLLEPFFADDPLKDKLDQICKESFNFDLPCLRLDQYNAMLELFHGPTLSFKDFGARFLSNCLIHIETDKSFTIMVATSGDTGSAVASAFYQKPKIKVIVLFPKGKISLRQQQQITCWQDNVCAVSVKGTFDDCQTLVKAAFADSWWQQNTYLNTSNSINIGRLLPQTTYYAYVAWQYYLEYGKKANFIVPSGNIGNVCACFWAKKMGLPINEIIISQNENNVIGQFLTHGILPNKHSIQTFANAMDVGKPSNFERLYALYNSVEDFRKNVKAFKATDQDIVNMIKAIESKYHMLICPHTATAFFARAYLPKNQDFIMVATAHPAKFEQVLEPIINKEVPAPKALQELLNRKPHNEEIMPKLEDLTHLYQMYFK